MLELNWYPSVRVSKFGRRSTGKVKSPLFITRCLREGGRLLTGWLNPYPSSR